MYFKNRGILLSLSLLTLSSCDVNSGVNSNNNSNSQSFSVHNLNRTIIYERDIKETGVTVGNRILYKSLPDNNVEEVPAEVGETNNQIVRDDSIDFINRAYNASQWLETQSSITSIGATISNQSSSALSKATPLTLRRDEGNDLFIDTGFLEVDRSEQYVAISTQPNGRVSVVAYRDAFNVELEEGRDIIVEQGRFTTFSGQAQGNILTNIPFEEGNQLDYSIQSVEVINTSDDEQRLEVVLLVPPYINVYVDENIAEVEEEGIVTLQVDLSEDSNITLIAPNGEDKLISISSLFNE